MAYIRKAIEYLRKQEFTDKPTKRKLDGFIKGLENLLLEIPSLGLDSADYDEILNLIGLNVDTGMGRVLKYLWEQGYVDGNTVIARELVKTKNEWYGDKLPREKIYVHLVDLEERGYIVRIKKPVLKVTARNPIEILKLGLTEHETNYKRRKKGREKEYEKKKERIERTIDRLSSISSKE